MGLSKPLYRIYVVDDSPILQRLLTEMLGNIPGVLVIGYSARAEEAVAEIVERLPDAIIVDLLLESGTGLDVLESVARQSTKPPLAIVLTNLAMAPYRERAANLGAAYFFEKSTQILQMIGVIDNLVHEHQKRYDSNQSKG